AQVCRGAEVTPTQLAGHREQLRFRLNGGSGAVGGSHAVVDYAVQLLGRPVSHVRDLVPLAALDQRVIEDVSLTMQN
ncbi:MAG: hypothetical protein ACLQUT_11705, partial [Thermoleophilia bacterium]